MVTKEIREIRETMTIISETSEVDQLDQSDINFLLVQFIRHCNVVKNNIFFSASHSNITPSHFFNHSPNSLY